MVAGGGLAMLSVPLIHGSGSDRPADASAIVTLAFIGFFAPSAVLSAVSPTIVKLQLRDLDVTGQVVGRLSAIGTTGAIAGTFVAGFVLVAAAATSAVILVLGSALAVAGFVLWILLALPRPSTTTLALVLVVTIGAGLLAAVSDGPCDVETRYHCARVVPDKARPGGRALWLDILRHSYVDLNDPKHLELRYSKVFADVLTATPTPDGRPPDVLHVGGGGFTMPRYLTAAAPGSRHLVYEIDPDLVELARHELGLVTGPNLKVEVGDARLLMRHLPSASRDIALGDAFGDLAVPWHLTTREFIADLHRVLRPGGFYMLNLIDYPPQRFVRAEVATLAAVFRHVIVVAPPSFLDGTHGGNYVVAASDRPFDGAGIGRLIQARQGEEVLLGDAEIAPFTGDGRVLTDDYAPVDQWLARTRRG
jgi:SAM-dependent methyltransferase